MSAKRFGYKYVQKHTMHALARATGENGKRNAFQIEFGKKHGINFLMWKI